MKPLTLFVLAIIPFSPPAVAQDRPATITVNARNLTPAQWSAEVTRKLDRSLATYVQSRWQTGVTGIVSVRFNVDQDNRPTGLSVSRQSGHSMLDRTAMRAIRNVGRMPQMPVTFRAGQTIRADIIFADDWAGYERSLKILRKEDLARRAIARKDQDTDFVLAAARSTADGF